MDNPKVPPVIKDVKEKPPFDYESITEIPGVDPLAQTDTDFDWHGLSILMSEVEQELDLEQRQQLAEAFRRLLEFALGSKDLDRTRLHRIGARLIALCWVLNPDVVGGVSITQLSRRLGFGRSILSGDSADARRQFGLKTRTADHAWNFRPGKN